MYILHYKGYAYLIVSLSSDTLNMRLRDHSEQQWLELQQESLCEVDGQFSKKLINKNKREVTLEEGWGLLLWDMTPCPFPSTIISVPMAVAWGNYGPCIQSLLDTGALGFLSHYGNEGKCRFHHVLFL